MQDLTRRNGIVHLSLFFAELVFARWQQSKMQSNLGPIRGVETLWQGDQLSPSPSSDYSLPCVLRILHYIY